MDAPVVPGGAETRPASEYPYDQLEIMALARNYHRWIMAACRPHLGSVVLEFGAGIGTLSAHLVAEPIERLILIDHAAALCKRLEARFCGDPRVHVLNATLEGARRNIGPRSVDSIVAVNVLEHVLDDVTTFRTARELLAPGGRLILFLPALRFLYGSMDRAFGHVRRYARRQLEASLTALGYQVLESRYMNLIGTLSWFVAGRALGRRTLSRGAVLLADRILIPITALLEGRFAPPFGQSLLVVARNP